MRITDWLQLGVALVLVVLAGAGAAAEAALASFSRSRAQALTEEQRPGARRVLKIAEDPPRYLNTALFLRTDSFPPMSNIITEWRDARACEADFGFAKPHCFRLPIEFVTPGLTFVYPARSVNPPSGDDEGVEFSIGVEKEIAQDLIEDPEWSQFFEFRGIDGEEKTSADGPIPI